MEVSGQLHAPTVCPPDPLTPFFEFPFGEETVALTAWLNAPKFECQFVRGEGVIAWSPSSRDPTLHDISVWSFITRPYPTRHFCMGLYLPSLPFPEFLFGAVSPSATLLFEVISPASTLPGISVWGCITLCYPTQRFCSVLYHPRLHNISVWGYITRLYPTRLFCLGLFTLRYPTQRFCSVLYHPRLPYATFLFGVISPALTQHFCLGLYHPPLPYPAFLFGAISPIPTLRNISVWGYITHPYPTQHFCSGLYTYPLPYATFLFRAIHPPYPTQHFCSGLSKDVRAQHRTDNGALRDGIGDAVQQATPEVLDNIPQSLLADIAAVFKHGDCFLSVKSILEVAAQGPNEPWPISSIHTYTHTCIFCLG
jgi:hypothetical protein